jgi:hypothetical protein
MGWFDLLFVAFGDAFVKYLRGDELTAPPLIRRSLHRPLIQRLHRIRSQPRRLPRLSRSPERISL